LIYYRDYKKVEILLTEYEKIKETEEAFQKECELKMEEYQEKIKYLIIV
jgi:predicted GIY-YIG superfamily endonuclease